MTRLLALLILPLPGEAVQLKQAAIDAWERHVDAANASMTVRLASSGPFLWTNESPARADKVRQGEVALAPIAAGKRVPDGLIHHWIGGIFIPDVRLADVFAVLSDYDRYPDYFKPLVVEAKLLAHDGQRYRFAMRWSKSAYSITTVLDTRWELHRSQVDEHRGYEFARTTNVQEIRNVGRPDETPLPAGEGNGFVWRASGISRYEQRDGGVYVELESMLLSRDIPAALRWFVKPFVDRTARNAMVTSLRQARQAVLRRSTPDRALRE